MCRQELKETTRAQLLFKLVYRGYVNRHDKTLSNTRLMSYHLHNNVVHWLLDTYLSSPPAYLCSVEVNAQEASDEAMAYHRIGGWSPQYPYSQQGWIKLTRSSLAGVVVFSVPCYNPTMNF